MFAYQHILVPVDFSPVSQRSIHRAKELVAQYQAKLSLLHIVEDIPLGVTAFGDVGAVYMAPDNQEEQIQAARKQLEEVASQMGLDQATELAVLLGYPSTSITEYAETHQVDLIVVGHSAKTGLLGLLMGSTAETISKHAKCDVLVMRVPKDAA